MVTFTILALLGILYVLFVFPWPVSLMFKLFLGLLVTWPVFALFVQIELPAGIPDLHYHRGYVGLMLMLTFMSAVLARSHGRPRVTAADTTEGSSLSDRIGDGSATQDAQTETAEEPFLASPFDLNRNSRELPWSAVDRSQLSRIPFIVKAYVILTGAAVFNGLATGGADTTVIAGYIDGTLVPVSMYFLAKRLIVSRQRLTWLLGAIILASLIVCITALYDRAMDLTESPFPIMPHNDAGDTRYLDVPRGRAAGVIGSPPVFGGLMGVAMLSSLCFFVHAERKRLKLLAGGFALLFAYAVVVTFTRSVWISVLFALMIAQFYFRGLWKLTMPLAVVGCLVVAVKWSGLQDNELVQDRLLDDQNVTGRVDRFVWSWMQFLERPILGRGPGALDEAMSKEFTVDGFATSHNTYMTMLVDKGALVFGLFWAIVLTWLTKAKSAIRLLGRDHFERSAVVAMVGFLTIRLLSGMSTELRYFPYYTVLFWVAGAVIERLHDLSVIGNEAPDAGSVARPIA